MNDEYAGTPAASSDASVSSTPVPSPPASRPRGNRRAALVLFLLLAYILSRTLIRADAPLSREFAEKTSKTLEALAVTKSAYTLRAWSRLAPPPAAAPSSKGKAPATDAAARLEADAVRQWRALANGKVARASDWRRLGIVLFEFDRPGGMEAFHRIASLPETAFALPRRNGAASEKPTLTPAQEVALWESIYGRQPLDRGRIETLRVSLSGLNLGWFEHLAASRLYARAGMQSEAKQAAETARAVARQPVLLNALQLLLILGGVSGLLAGSIFLLLHRIQRWPFPAHGLTYWPSGARMSVFVSALAIMVLSSLPISLLRLRTEDWSAASLLRLGLFLQLAVYLPMLGMVFWLLRRQAAAESPQAPHPGFRRALEAIGLRAVNPFTEAGLGLTAYIVVFPLFLIVAALSSRLFSRFAPPVNEIQILMMGMQANADRLLLLLTVAVAAPIVEEILFRGLLYPALRERWGVAGGALLSGAIFAAVHPTIPTGFLPLALLGVAFALMTEWRGSLLPGIVMHGLHNGFVILTALTLLA